MFCIDLNGIIHCVWRYLEPGYPKSSRIYYSKSSSNGLNWQEPCIVNDKENVTFQEPTIAVNSKGDVAIAYTKGGYYTSSYVCLTHKVGDKWIEDTISSDMPGSMRPLIGCDNNDVFYYLWFYTGPYGNIYYRKIDVNFNMSPIMDMIIDTNLNLAVGNLCFDKTNCLHFMVNYNSYLHQSSDTRSVYYILNSNTCEFQHMFGYSLCSKSMVLLDNNNNTYVSWMQFDNEIPLSFDCYISKFSNEEWSEGILVADSMRDYSMTIDGNSNCYFFISHESANKNYSQLYCYYPIETGWKRHYLNDSESFSIHVKSTYYNDGIYIIYDDYEFSEDSSVKYSNIMFRRTDLIYSRDEQISKNKNIRIYPNPFRNELHISGAFGTDEVIQLEIFTYDGILIFSDQIAAFHQEMFNYSWNGATSSGQKPKEGIYLLRLTSGKSVVCKTIININ